MENSPDSIAYTFSSHSEIIEKLTYKELFEDCSRLSLVIKNLTKEEDIVLIAVTPSLNYIRLIYACLLANRIFLPTSSLRSRHDIARIEFMLEKIPISLIIHDSKIDEIILKDHLNKTKAKLLSNILQMQPKAVDLAQTFRPTNTPIFLQTSSGTTRFPKAVMVQEEAIISCLQAMKDTLELSPNDIGVSWLPPFHDMGLIGTIFLPLYANFPIHLSSPKSFLLNPLQWLKAITQHKATITAAPNLAYDLCSYKFQRDYCSSLDLSSLRLAINSSEMIRAQTLCKFYEKFKEHGFRWESFTPAYGLAEATLMVACKNIKSPPYIQSFLRDSLHKGKPIPCDEKNSDTIDLVSSGKMVHNMSCRIVDRYNLKPLAPYEIGEIWIKGNSLTLGYYKDIISTELNFNQQYADNNEKYLRTGDSGFVDDHGQLFITGRVKDIVKTSIGNIAAEEIEALIESEFFSDPSYRTAALLLDGQDKSEIVIVKEIKNTDDLEDLSLKLYTYVKMNMFLKIDKIVYVPRGSLPLTTSGKIKRHAALILLKNDLFEAYHSFIVN